jgi:hypothetical protein
MDLRLSCDSEVEQLVCLTSNYPAYRLHNTRGETDSTAQRTPTSTLRNLSPHELSGRDVERSEGVRVRPACRISTHIRAGKGSERNHSPECRRALEVIRDTAAIGPKRLKGWLRRIRAPTGAEWRPKESATGPRPGYAPVSPPLHGQTSRRSSRIALPSDPDDYPRLPAVPRRAGRRCKSTRADHQPARP